MLFRMTLLVSILFFKAAGSAQCVSELNALAASERNCAYKSSDSGVLKMSRTRFPPTSAIEVSVGNDWGVWRSVEDSGVFMDQDTEPTRTRS